MRIENDCYLGHSVDEYWKIIKSVATKIPGRPYVYPLNDGRYVEITDFPIAGGEMLSLHEDITRRTNDQTVLLEQNQVLGEAISIMHQAIALYDANQNVVICNERYSTFYGLEAGAISAGMNAYEIVELRIAGGCYPATSADAYRSEVKQKLDHISSGSRIFHLEDGRTIEIHRHVMESGGWLAIHDDVTAQSKSELELSRLMPRNEVIH